MTPDYKCEKCGELMHLGRCGEPSKFKPNFYIQSLPTGEQVVKINGRTVAGPFDDRAEAQEWIDSQQH